MAIRKRFRSRRLKPSTPDTINLNLQFTRSWFQTPNSYDAQNATAWSGLVVDNGGLGPNGLPVGSTDQRSKIRTFNVAPTWTHLLIPIPFSHSAASHGKINTTTIQARDPFADLIPDLQSTTIGQNRRLTNLGLRGDVSYVKGIHNIKAGSYLSGHDSIGKGYLRNCRPDAECGLFESDGSTDTDPTVTNPAQCVGIADTKSGIRSSARLL